MYFDNTNVCNNVAVVLYRDNRTPDQEAAQVTCELSTHIEHN